MATYSVKNGSHLDKAFKVRGGFHVVAAGKAETVKDAKELSDKQIVALEKDGVKVSVSAAKAGKAETGIKAILHDGDKYNVVKGDDVLLSDLSKDDADAFNAMSEVDKAAYVASSKPKA